MLIAVFPVLHKGNYQSMCLKLENFTREVCVVFLRVQPYICLPGIVLRYHSGQQHPQRQVSRIAVNKK